ncbi:hypothetical protein A2U01_0000776 [Trifolium medium]|uniref:Reverse transcriptase domain-containing protein n=1 Tax=Trifolium medium TaxID=97028 RepID=A0A392M0C1_9FABA|nr:hypothetical protein [Trifolium medium]
MSELPWCIVVDFNDLLAQEDKKGIHPHPNWLCNGFRSAVCDCDLTDIHLEGYLYTWVKSRGSPNVIEERLDSAMTNSNWLMIYPSVKLVNLLTSHSDHSPILLQTSSMVRNGRTYAFRFENSWLKEDDIDEVVEDGWVGRGALILSVKRLGRFKEIPEKHTRLLMQEEAYWKQRAKMHWLKEWDLNTIFFHMSASSRQQAKKIGKLVNEENVAVTTQPKLCEDNERLVMPITREELKEALFQMHPDKAPGPDGFNPAFYQHFWDLCGNDVFEAATEWLERGYFPSSLNETNICLIPKCDNPLSMKDLRPISLCNVLYKMISKLLANRLKGCIEGRSIVDNALIAIEVIHALKRRTRGTKGELALKIDISKAYDKVDWGFMRVLVNFEKVGPIFPGRGLRQGDPLSPYLFILITKGLTTFIKRSMIAEATHLMKILKTYEEASGQEINLTKSEVFFSRNLSIAAQEDLSKIMGVRHVLGTGNYLGLPSMIGRKKKDVFTFIKDRIWKRIKSWRGRALSRAGKEVMIKSMLQAIPSYVMSVYLLPDSTVKDIERMMNSFWWGGGANNKGIWWLAWDRMTYPKTQGGLGLRDIHTFNLAMIASKDGIL